MVDRRVTGCILFHLDNLNAGSHGGEDNGIHNREKNEFANLNFVYQTFFLVVGLVMFFNSMNRGLINGGRHFGSRFLGFLGVKRFIFWLLIGEFQLVWECISRGSCYYIGQKEKEISITISTWI